MFVCVWWTREKGAAAHKAIIATSATPPPSFQSSTFPFYNIILWIVPTRRWNDALFPAFFATCVQGLSVSIFKHTSLTSFAFTLFSLSLTCLLFSSLGKVRWCIYTYHFHYIYYIVIVLCVVFLHDDCSLTSVVLYCLIVTWKCEECDDNWILIEWFDWSWWLYHTKCSLLCVHNSLNKKNI